MMISTYPNQVLLFSEWREDTKITTIENFQWKKIRRNNDSVEQDENQDNVNVADENTLKHENDGDDDDLIMVTDVKSCLIHSET